MPPLVSRDIRRSIYVYYEAAPTAVAVFLQHIPVRRAFYLYVL